MATAPLVTIIAVSLAIVVIAAFLITVIYVLLQVHSRLNTILGVVAGVVEKTEGLEPIIDEIRADLADGHAAIDAAVERLKVRKGVSASPNGPEPAGFGAGPPTATVPGPPPTTTVRNY